MQGVVLQALRLALVVLVERQMLLMEPVVVAVGEALVVAAGTVVAVVAVVVLVAVAVLAVLIKPVQAAVQAAPHTRVLAA
jgi:hypothetical protein